MTSDHTARDESASEHTVSTPSEHDRADKAVLTLKPPEHGVERRAMLWWALQSLTIAVPVIAACLIGAHFWEAARFWLLLAAGLAGIFLVVGTIVEPLWRYRVHRWETSETAVYARTGWLLREWRVAPLSRVQTVDALQGPYEQLLRLSTLRVTTASSAGAITIGGLDRKVALRIAAELTEIAELTPGDAT